MQSLTLILADDDVRSVHFFILSVDAGVGVSDVAPCVPGPLQILTFLTDILRRCSEAVTG